MMRHDLLRSAVLHWRSSVLARVIRPGEWAVESLRPIATLLGSCVGSLPVR